MKQTLLSTFNVVNWKLEVEEGGLKFSHGRTRVEVSCQGVSKFSTLLIYFLYVLGSRHQ